jgi:uncharacterized protein YceK
MRYTILALAALSLGGCGSIQSLTGATPAQQRSFVLAIPCLVNSAAMSAAGVEARTINGRTVAGSAAQGVTALINVSSEAACTLANGFASAAVSVPASTVATVVVP